MSETYENETLEIWTNNTFYDKKSKILSIHFNDSIFAGLYKKSTKLKTILEDLSNALKVESLSFKTICLKDSFTHKIMSHNKKLHQLKLAANASDVLIRKKQYIDQIFKDKGVDAEHILRKLLIDSNFEELKSEIKNYLKLIEGKKELQETKKSKNNGKSARMIGKKRSKAKYPSPKINRDRITTTKEEIQENLEEIENFEEHEIDDVDLEKQLLEKSNFSEPSRSLLKVPPSQIYKKEIVDKEMVDEPKRTITKYDINLGLQYYPVMMEQRSYLFYIYLSHEELKIFDEEGKTIIKTSFSIKTDKKEPPKLTLRIEGEGFETHPVFGEVIVKKDSVNPPVMIFSIMPVKKKGKNKKKKLRERRYLNMYVEFENKVVHHSILSIIVQPKHYTLEIGPIKLSMSKQTAMIISLISILIAGISLIYTIFSVDITSGFIDAISTFAPGLGSILFIIIFLITLFKDGIYPLKEKINYFLNLDKTGVLMK